MIQKLIAKHDLEYLLANIKIAEDSTSKGRVKNPAAYLIKAIQNDYRHPKLVQTIDEKLIAKKSIEKFNTSENKFKLKQQIASLSKGTLMDCKKNFELYLNDNPFFKKILETKGIENDIIQNQWLRFMRSKFI